MKIFGFEVSSASEIKKLREDVGALADLERQLEDIGWMNINNPQSGLLNETRESYVRMVKRSRLAYVKNPVIAQGVDLTTYYVFGDGVADPKAKSEDVQEIIKNFWNDPDNRLSLTSPVNQFKLSNKLQYDGELIFALMPDIDGTLYVRLIDPLSISKVIFDRVDGMRPLFYEREMGVSGTQIFADHSNAKYLFREEEPEEYKKMLKELGIEEKTVMPNVFIYHVKINNDILDRRGIPFVYRALDWGNSNAKMANDMASFINAQAQYAVKKKVKGTKQQIDAMAARIKQNSTLTNPSFQAGSTLMQNQLIDTEMVGLPSSTGQLFETGLRRSLLMMCSAFGIMEHYFGDPSTGNLATATAMELPMLKKFLAMRKMWEGVFDDIVNFQLDMKLFSENPGAFLLNPIKNRYKILSDYPDRFFDIDFPPILEKDLKSLADALIAAKKNQLMPIETAQRLFLAAAGVNNIEEELQKEFQEPELAPLNPFFNQNGDAPSVKESADIPDSITAKRQKALKLADKNKAVLSTMRSYLKEIGQAYGRMSKGIKESSKVSGHVHPVDQSVKARVEMARPDLYVKNFISEMRGLGRKYIPRAAGMGLKYAESHSPIKEGQLREAFNKAIFEDNRIALNSQFLEESLMPALEKRFNELDGAMFSSESEATAAISEAISSFETRIGSYASFLWGTAELAAKEALPRDYMVNFVGVEDDKNCSGCMEAIAGNPWPAGQAPVPGEQDCMSNCRHALQAVGDESLTESDKRLLIEAEQAAKDGFKLL